MLVAFKSPVKFSKSVYSMWNFVQSLKLCCKNNFCQSLWITRNQTLISTVNWVAFREEIRQVYSTEILSNIATIREVNSTEIDSVLLKIVQRERHRITRHYSAELQTAKQTLTTSKILIEFTYGDFPCHLKVNRNKLALINRRWKCKKGERLTITANSFKKIDQLDGFRPL